MSAAKPKSNEREFLVQMDRLPEREKIHEKFKNTLRSLAAFYNFEPIATSAVEDARGFLPAIKAGLFEERAPVSCKTRSGVEVFLRPSTVLGMVRAYVTHKMADLPQPIKLSFSGDTFFITQKREGNVTAQGEWGVVMVGEGGPVAEAEIIQTIWKALGEIGFRENTLQVRLNATGCAACRPSFRSPYTTYFRSRAARLCKNCKRFLKRTPTRVLWCEEEKCRVISTHAPQILDFLCEMCKKHLRGLLEFLDEVKIPYFLDPRLFREGSWFNGIVFEFVTVPGLDNKDAKETERKPDIIAEGGLLSKFGESISGRHLDIAAGAVFLDLAEGAYLKQSAGETTNQMSMFLAHLGDLAKRRSLVLLEELRAGGMEVKESLGRDSIKSQLKIAERLGADIALVLGQKEALDNTIIVREVSSGIQETIPQDKLIEFLKKKLKK